MAKKLIAFYEYKNTQGISFDPIIGYGKNAADPHHGPDNTMPQKGDSVIIDIGCRVGEYVSDMTRTVFYQEVSPKHAEIYNIVKEANQGAISIIKPGIKFSDVDNAARDHIQQAGYGKYFTHRTGHSVGIDVYEHGDVSAVNHEILEEGMVFSVQPGIYLPGEMGVRIEDLVLVTKDGYEVLNKVTKELQIIDDQYQPAPSDWE